MRIEEKNGNQITNIEKWEKLFDTPKQKKHWKPGRSAHSIADYILNNQGEEHICDLVQKALNEKVFLERAIPEYEVKFDNLGKGRVHDLGVFGHTQSGKSLFIGIESKVDESFGDTVRKAYIKSKSAELSGTSTNRPKRIENLLKMHFKKVVPSAFGIRYQLLYATAGTIAERSDIFILLILVFKTALYDEKKGAANFQDYLRFMGMLKPEKEIAPNEPRIDRLSIGNKELITVYESIIMN